jgi:hypothetical protein
MIRYGTENLDGVQSDSRGVEPRKTYPSTCDRSKVWAEALCPGSSSVLAFPVADLLPPVKSVCHY